MDDLFQAPCKIVVMGIGGGGCNAINAMIQANIKNVKFVGVNTDTQALSMCRASYKVQIGKDLTHGLGSGAIPDTGKKSAIESKDDIIAAIDGANMLFIAAGMGGGTGTGASPIVAEIARERNILTIAVVTIPFNIEGQKRIRNANEGIENLKDIVDAMVVIPNQKLFDLPEAKDLSVVDAFKLADKVLLNCIRGVTDVITNCATINLDFADVRNMLQRSGTIHIGIGSAKVNPAVTNESDITNAIMRTVKDAIDNQLIDMNIQNACDVIVNIVAGKWFKMHEVNNICTYIRNVASRPDLNLLLGLSTAPEYEDNITITIIAAKFQNDFELPNDNKEVAVAYNRSQQQSLQQTTEVVETKTVETTKNKNEYSVKDNETNIVVDDDSKVPSFLRRFGKKKKIKID